MPNSQSTRGDVGEAGEKKEFQTQVKPSGYRWGFDWGLGDFTWEHMPHRSHMVFPEPTTLGVEDAIHWQGLGFVPYQENRG